MLNKETSAWHILAAHQLIKNRTKVKEDPPVTMLALPQSYDQLDSCLSYCWRPVGIVFKDISRKIESAQLLLEFFNFFATEAVQVQFDMVLDKRKVRPPAGAR